MEISPNTIKIESINHKRPNLIAFPYQVSEQKQQSK